MSKKNLGMNLFEGFQSGWTQAMEANRKNLQALTEANQRAVEGWQTLARRQAEMVTEFLQDNSTATFATATTPQKFAIGTENINSVYQRSINNTKELAELAGQYTKDAAEVITKRAQECVEEMNATTAKAAKDAMNNTMEEAAE
jgi:phasin family protein